MNIDHKAEAERLLAGGHTAAALVHATLYAAEQTAALVEQERIANEIAYVVKISAYPTILTSLHPADVDSFHALSKSIREALGLA